MKLDVFAQRSHRLFYLLPILCHEVAANTEIINFASSREHSVDLPSSVVGNWPTLRASDNERRWTLEPAALHAPLHQVCEEDVDAGPPFSCPHELWLLLDLDDEPWASYAAFTLRLSWPASTPAEFLITSYAPQDLLARLSERGVLSTVPVPGRGGQTHAHARTHAHAHTHARPSSSSPHTTSSSTPHAPPTTRSRYARIRAVDAGVPTPGRIRHALRSVPTQPRTDEGGGPVRLAAGANVSFVVILEPLYVGVLPATLLPTVGFLVPVVLAAALLVPWVAAYLEPFVRRAREDMDTSVARARKER